MFQPYHRPESSGANQLRSGIKISFSSFKLSLTGTFLQGQKLTKMGISNFGLIFSSACYQTSSKK
jgi:hypothetical protein